MKSHCNLEIKNGAFYNRHPSQGKTVGKGGLQRLASNLKTSASVYLAVAFPRQFLVFSFNFLYPDMLLKCYCLQDAFQDTTNKINFLSVSPS